MKNATFGKPLRLAEVPPSGRSLHLQATEPEREAIAKRLNIVSVEALSADLTVKPMAGDNYRIDGRITGAVTRNCVVTLVPVGEAIDEEIGLVLRPPLPQERDARHGRQPHEPMDLPVEGEEDSEPYFGNEVDLGSLLVEYVALGLNPYPRAEGVEFTQHIEDDAGADSPFAVLEELKRRSN